MSLTKAARCGGPRLSFLELERFLDGCAETVARQLGVHPRQVYRWRRYGVTWAQADELAVGVGLHPAEVWVDW